MAIKQRLYELIKGYIKRKGYYQLGKVFVLMKSSKFNATWYKKTYQIEGNPYTHYLDEGWKKYYSPSKHFSTLNYLLQNQDVRKAGLNPLIHYETNGKHEPNRIVPIENQALAVGVTQDMIFEYERLQNKRIKEVYSRRESKLIVYLVPDFDQICGGMMCISNYHDDIRGLKETEGFVSILATVPSRNTFPDYTKFDAHGHVYRFSQIYKHFRNLEELFINIPEYQFEKFLYCLSGEEVAWLATTKNITINIMNQNNELMPEPIFVDMLRKVVPNLTMTCAHKQYCNNNIRSTYSMPLHYIPADKKIEFNVVPYNKKKNLLLLSPDFHPLRDFIVLQVQKIFPDIKIIIIENMPFKEYLRLLGEAKWLISFGEGFDGYTVESIYSGTISFSVFNDTFFEADFKKWPNMYESFEQMSRKIALDMLKYSSKVEYNKFLGEIQECCYNEFASHHYMERLANYYAGKFDIPFNEVVVERKKAIKENKKISIIMVIQGSAPYLQEQMKSILAQDYKNFELVVSTIDCNYRTIKILQKYSADFPIKILKGGAAATFNSKFKQCLEKAEGSFIAPCNQDDIWYSDRLSLLVERSDGFDASFGRLDYIDGNGNPIEGHRSIFVDQKNLSRFYQVGDLLIRDQIKSCSMLIKADVAKEAANVLKNEDIPIGWWLSLYPTITGTGCVFIGKAVQQYRIHPEKFDLKLYDSEKYYTVTRSISLFIMNEFSSLLSKRDIKLITLTRNLYTICAVFKNQKIANVESFIEMNRFSFTNEVMAKIQKEIQHMEIERL
ncbi:MAG: glycosyltransferase [Oscillospiraceae bacterium]